MSIRVRPADDEVRIEVRGRFDFSSQRAFRDAYRGFPADRRYRVDLSGAEYLDSSALGMLLLLRKHAGDRRERVVLSGANETIRRILDIANFGKLFTIE